MGGTKQRRGVALLVLLFWLVVWQLLYLAVGRDILVVSPLQTLRRLLELAGRQSFWASVGTSCLRVLAGFGLAVAAGSLLAAGAARSAWLHTLLRPLMGIVKATPVASFIILALIWISSGRLPVFSAFLMVLPVVWSNLYAGIIGADRELLEMAAVFRFSRMKLLRLIYLPAVMPHFTAACSAGLGFAWKSVVAAEVIAHPKHSIGSGIYDAKIYLETADLFAWTAAVILLSILLEKATIRLLERMGRSIWAPGGETA